MDNNSTRELIKRLDVLLSALMNPIGDTPTDQQKIQRLDSFGFTPTEIASILGSTGEKVSKQLYVIRNKKGGKDGR